MTIVSAHRLGSEESYFLHMSQRADARTDQTAHPTVQLTLTRETRIPDSVIPILRICMS